MSTYILNDSSFSQDLEIRNKNMFGLLAEDECGGSIFDVFLGIKYVYMSTFNKILNGWRENYNATLSPSFFLDSFGTKETVNRIRYEKVNVDYYCMTEQTYYSYFYLPELYSKWMSSKIILHFWKFCLPTIISRK